MTERRTPQTIAAHMRRTLNPALIAALGTLGYEHHQLTRRVTGCAVTVESVDLAAIAASLASERHTATGGRPRGESGGGSGSTVANPTADIAGELYRIRDIGLTLQEAIDRLHPDPGWPAIESGLRQRTTCATEAVLLCCAEALGTLNRERCYDNIADSIDGLEAATRHAHACARRAVKVRAWHGDPTDVDPPDMILEAARCSSWPLGVGKDGEKVRCGNYRGSGHLNPHTDRVEHDDLCDDCHSLVCGQCWSRVKRSAGYAVCDACEIKARRARSAA